jgi:hypothetical protein
MVGLDGSPEAGAALLTLLPGQPAEALQRLAAEGAYDLVVVGGRGTGLSKVLLGSTATTLQRLPAAPIPSGSRPTNLGPFSLWPTRIRQRLRVGWEARVLM